MNSSWIRPPTQHKKPENTWCSPGLNPRPPAVYYIYINDLPLLAGINSKIVLFADDTSSIMTSSNQAQLKTVLYKTLSDLNSWFKANLLSLNIDKTCLLYFRNNNNNIDNTLTIHYMNKTITNIPSVKFLGLLMHDTLKLGQAHKSNSFKTELCMLHSACTYPSAINKCIKDAILFLCKLN